MIDNKGQLIVMILLNTDITMGIQLLVDHEYGCQSIINIKVHNNVMLAGSYDSDKIAKFSCLL